VKKLATREQKVKFAIKRFKGFWNQFKRSKRGILGISVIIFFTLMAVFAPVIAPYKPIEPQYAVGEYQAKGLGKGLPIAQKLCVPVWYKYLPWVKRGITNITETFYIFTIVELGTKWVLYTPEDYYKPWLPLEQRINSSDSIIRLTHRISAIRKVQAVLPNGTSRVLVENVDWEYAPMEREKKTRSVRALQINRYFPDDTRIDVTYETGVDLVENMEVVKDYHFTSSQNIKEWGWTSNSTSVNVTFNNEEGFKFKPDDPTEDSGCLQASYSSQGTSSPNSVEITLYHNFTYPYLQPPEKFWIHTSIMSKEIRKCIMEILFYNEEESTEYLLQSQPVVLQTGKYKPIELASTKPAVATQVGVNPPQDKIFATPGKYRFEIRIKFVPPKTGSVNIYFDHINCLFYGNAFGLLGTDYNAGPYPEDIFSSLVYGTRVSLIVGILTAVFSTFIGLFLGLISGYVGGVVDEGIMRFADLLLVLPTLPLFIVLITALRATSGFVSMWNIIFILTFFGWMSFARSVRSMVLSIRERAFIEAAKAAGGGTMHIINRHIIPNVFALVYITLATSVPGAIITEASLSWLGLGDKRLASWGKMLYDFNNSGIVTSKGLLEYWFWVFPTCISIALLAMAFILVGYALDEILNPRLRERR